MTQSSRERGMAIQRTFAMIKPDSYKNGHVGEILSMIEKKGFKIVHLQSLKFTDKSAKTFYKEHEGKSFFNGLIESICSDKIVAMVLEKDNAISDLRKLMGNTDPSKAEAGTIRKLFGKGMPDNAIHGSDSAESAKREITFIFGEFASIPSVDKKAAKDY